MGVNVSEVFGQNVFDESVMKNRLPEATYNEIKKIMHEGGDITMDIANIVAQAMKEWAVEKGATHYTHVFQPYIISVGAENMIPSHHYQQMVRSIIHLQEKIY